MNQVQALLDQIGLIRLAVIAGAIVVFIVIRKLLASGRSTSNIMGQARCTCGWSGSASRHRPICPRCGSVPYVE